jgi:hypothetical protein
VRKTEARCSSVLRLNLFCSLSINNMFVQSCMWPQKLAISSFRSLCNFCIWNYVSVKKWLTSRKRMEENTKRCIELSFVRSFGDWMKDFHDLLSQRLEWSPLCFASLMIWSMYLELIEILLVFCTWMPCARLMLCIELTEQKLSSDYQQLKQRFYCNRMSLPLFFIY